MSYVTKCTEILNKTQRLLVISGAGISAESGIPPYRGQNGAYSRNANLPALMSAEGFKIEPDRVWKQIEEMRLRVLDAEPNAAHRVLAKWEREKRFLEFLIATQNIDGLHQKAGSGRVTELHGNIWQLARPRTVSYAEDEQFSEDLHLMTYPDMRDEILQRWSEENEQEIWQDLVAPFPHIPPFDDPEIRPNILLYDEPYGSRLVWVEDFINGAPDTVLVIGCSGQVALLAQLLTRCREANPACSIININPQEDCIEVPHEYLPISAVTALSELAYLL
jgi:NAD-dependent SIR2 family protein deacetylase